MDARGDVVTKTSARPVAELTERLVSLAQGAGLTVFGVIDQRAAAEEVGATLRPTTLVLLGSPRAGTPVMAAVPLVALDLPLKVLLWSDGDGGRVSYLSPHALEDRYDLPAELRGRFDGLDALTDALTAPEALSSP